MSRVERGRCAACRRRVRADRLTRPAPTLRREPGHQHQRHDDRRTRADRVPSDEPRPTLGRPVGNGRTSVRVHHLGDRRLLAPRLQHELAEDRAGEPRRATQPTNPFHASPGVGTDDFVQQVRAGERAGTEPIASHVHRAASSRFGAARECRPPNGFSTSDVDDVGRDARCRRFTPNSSDRAPASSARRHPSRSGRSTNPTMTPASVLYRSRCIRESSPRPERPDQRDHSVSLVPRPLSTLKVDKVRDGGLLSPGSGRWRGRRRRPC